jgi:hypothetical protein
MSKIANFENIIFNEHLGDRRGDLPNFEGLNFAGDASRLATFNIENPPVDDGYVLLSLWDVQRPSHKIELNGVDIFTTRIYAYQYGSHKSSNWVVPFDSNILRQGSNSLQMLRDTNGGDNFHLYTAIVNWKEEVQFPRNPRLNFFQRVFG